MRGDCTARARIYFLCTSTGIFVHFEQYIHTPRCLVFRLRSCVIRPLVVLVVGFPFRLPVPSLRQSDVYVFGDTGCLWFPGMLVPLVPFSGLTGCLVFRHKGPGHPLSSTGGDSPWLMCLTSCCWFWFTLPCHPPVCWSGPLLWHHHLCFS